MCIAQISSLLATLLYENQQYIKSIMLLMSNKIYVPHLSTVGVDVSKVCVSPLVSRSVDPVCFITFVSDNLVTSILPVQLVYPPFQTRIM